MQRVGHPLARRENLKFFYEDHLLVNQRYVPLPQRRRDVSLGDPGGGLMVLRAYQKRTITGTFDCEIFRRPDQTMGVIPEAQVFLGKLGSQ